MLKSLTLQLFDIEVNSYGCCLPEQETVICYYVVKIVGKRIYAISWVFFAFLNIADLAFNDLLKW